MCEATRMMTHLPGSQTNSLLGYPDNARLLIINADDFGRSHACNAGILRSLKEAVVSSTKLDLAGKSAWFAGALRALPSGLSEWAAHPALDTPELHAYEPESWQAYPTDLDFLISQQARSIIEQEGIVLLSYQPLQRVWQERGSSTT